MCVLHIARQVQGGGHLFYFGTKARYPSEEDFQYRAPAEKLPT
jgi:hypothetical protein